MSENQVLNFKDSLIVAEKIALFFKGFIIGSVKLIPIGLSESLINDIDVAISSENYETISIYLMDNGYKETKSSGKDRYGSWFSGSKFFVKDGHIPIHLNTMIGQHFKLWNAYEIVASKMERGTVTDLNQIQNIIDYKRSKLKDEKK